MGKDYYLEDKNIEAFLKSNRFNDFIQKMNVDFNVEKNTVLKEAYKGLNNNNITKLSNDELSHAELSDAEVLKQMELNVKSLADENTSVEEKINSVKNLFTLSDVIDKQEVIDVDAENYTVDGYRTQCFADEMSSQIDNVGHYIDECSTLNDFKKDDYETALHEYEQAQSDLEEQVYSFVAAHPDEEYNVSKLAKGVKNTHFNGVIGRNSLFQNPDFQLDSIGFSSAFSDMENNYQTEINKIDASLQEATDVVKKEHKSSINKINESVKEEIDNLAGEYSANEEKYNQLNQIVNADGFEKSYENESGFVNAIQNVEKAGKALENSGINDFDFLKFNDEVKKQIGAQNAAFFAENITKADEKIASLNTQKAELDASVAELEATNQKEVNALSEQLKQVELEERDVSAQNTSDDPELKALDASMAELDKSDMVFGDEFAEAQLEGIKRGIESFDNFLKDKSEANLENIGEVLSENSYSASNQSYIDEINNQHATVTANIEARDEAYRGLAESVADEKNYTDLATVFENFVKKQEQFSKEAKAYDDKQKPVNKLNVGLPDNLNAQLWDNINNNLQNGDFQALSSNLQEIKNTLTNNIVNIQSKSNLIEEKSAYKNIKNNLNDYYAENIKLYQEISKYSDNFAQIEAAENKTNDSLNKIYESVGNFKNHLTKSANELETYTQETKNREEAKAENEKKAKQKELSDKKQARQEYLDNQKKEKTTALANRKKELQDSIEKLTADKAEKTEKFNLGYQQIDKALAAMGSVKDALKTGSDFVKDFANSEYSKTKAAFAASSEKHKEYVSKLENVKSKADTLKAKAEETKENKMSQITEKSKTMLVPFVKAKQSLDKVKSDISGLREASANLKNKLNVLNKTGEAYENSLGRKKEDLKQAFEKENADMSRRENSYFDTIINSKKTFGSDSEYFKNVKDEIQKFKDFKANEAFSGGRISEKYEENAKSLLTSLNAYILNRDTPDGKKSTRIGQQRLENIKNLKASIENRINMINAYKKDMDAIDASKPEKIAPKSRLETTIALDRQDNEYGLVNARLTNQDVFKNKEERILNAVLSERKTENKEKKAAPSVSAPEKKKEEPALGK